VDSSLVKLGTKVAESEPKAAAFYKELLDNLADGVYLVDVDRRITYWNRGAERITGYTSAEVTGHLCRDNLLVHTDAEGNCLCLAGCPLLAAIVEGTTRQSDVFLRHKDGHRVPVSVRSSPIRDAGGRVTGGVEVFSDNSSKLAAIERAAEMEQLALIDPLTTVGNRRYTERVLREKHSLFRREGDVFAVLLLDLDRFKTVNDRYGHDAGDAVLQAVSRTLVNNLRSFDFLGRWGGEEFLAVLTNADAARATLVAGRCCGLVRSCQVRWSGHVIQPTISIGAAVVKSGDSIDSLLARADARLYAAKQAGRDGFRGPEVA
jgi:diguanylate cyclase (GGDEF)-like protein/PAS domain S-box-containing protein